MQDQYSHANKEKRHENVRPRCSRTVILSGPMYGTDKVPFPVDKRLKNKVFLGRREGTQRIRACRAFGYTELEVTWKESSY